MASFEVRSGRCAECGGWLDRDMATDAAKCRNSDCRTNQVDWGKGVTEPGPVRARTRDELLQDARRGLWRDVITTPIPTDRPVILTRNSGEHGGWLLSRFDCSRKHDTSYIYGLPATHWAEDSLGTP